MSRRSMHVGVIGRGFGARVVAPAFEDAGCVVVDVVSPRDEDAVRALCARSDLDLVSVHSPPFLHHQHVGWVVDAGHAVLCDKPFGCDADEAASIQRIVGDSGVLAFANLEFRHHPAREAAQALVQDGAIGDVRHVHWAMFSNWSRGPRREHGWLYDASLGGGLVGAWGSHAIDFLRWTFGEIVDATATCRTDVPLRPGHDGIERSCTAEDGFTAWLRTAGGVTITIDGSFASPIDLPVHLTVIGSEGILEVVADRRITIRTESGGRDDIAVRSDGGDPHTLPMRRYAVVVRNALGAGVVPVGEPTLADGVACAVVMDRLRPGGNAIPSP